jgi:hypothetical protein
MQTKLKVAVVVALLGIAAFIGVRLFFSRDRAVQQNAVARREIALRVLGEYVAGQAGGRQAVIVSNPFTQRSGAPGEVLAFEQAGLRGLKQGWRQNVRLAGVFFPELSPAALADPSAVNMPPDATTPLSFLTAERAWDALLKQYPDADLVVSLIGLPADLPALELWQRPKPQFALLLPDLRLLGDRPAIVAAFRRGKLLAAVLNRPGAPPESAALERDHDAEFKQHFVLVTAENLEAVLAIYPGLF